MWHGIINQIKLKMRKCFGFQKFVFVKLLILVLCVGISCTFQQKETPIEINDYEIASPVYATLAEKSLDLLSSFEFDSFAMMLSDNVEYVFPNGEKISGKTALINYWKNYKNTSGIESMQIINANYLPVDTHLKPKGDENAGVKVFADFTNKMVFQDKEIDVRMNFHLHFNKEKMVDKMTTYYDSSWLRSVSLPTKP